MIAPNAFLEVTELAGDEVSREQVIRMESRYVWAGGYCAGKDVLEVACGTGQGLGYLAARSKSLVAGDVSQAMIERARAHYGARVDIRAMDAQKLPLPDRSLDVVILFEAIYYLPDADRFVRECARVLRPGGFVLVASANKDLYDFNPSPYSHTYYGVVELGRLFARHGFACTFFGDTPVHAVSPKQRLLRPLKHWAARLGLIPRTMAGKKMLKRLVFGGLVSMPAEIAAAIAVQAPPTKLSADAPDRGHKVVFCAAQLAP